MGYSVELIMDYSNEDITKRAEESSLWRDLDKQQGKALPYLLERYLLLENWKHLDKFNKEYLEHYGGREINEVDYDINYLHLLLADAITVLLNQEERIRILEENSKNT
jgi:hypothetical protein